MKKNNKKSLKRLRYILGSFYVAASSYGSSICLDMDKDHADYYVVTGKAIKQAMAHHHQPHELRSSSDGSVVGMMSILGTECKISGLNKARLLIDFGDDDLRQPALLHHVGFGFQKLTVSETDSLYMRGIFEGLSDITIYSRSFINQSILDARNLLDINVSSFENRGLIRAGFVSVTDNFRATGEGDYNTILNYGRIESDGSFNISRALSLKNIVLPTMHKDIQPTIYAKGSIRMDVASRFENGLGCFLGSSTSISLTGHPHRDHNRCINHGVIQSVKVSIAGGQLEQTGELEASSAELKAFDMDWSSSVAGCKQLKLIASNALVTLAPVKAAHHVSIIAPRVILKSEVSATDTHGRVNIHGHVSVDVNTHQKTQGVLHISGGKTHLSKGVNVCATDVLSLHGQQSLGGRQNILAAGRGISLRSDGSIDFSQTIFKTPAVYATSNDTLNVDRATFENVHSATFESQREIFLNARGTVHHLGMRAGNIIASGAVQAQTVMGEASETIDSSMAIHARKIHLTGGQVLSHGDQSADEAIYQAKSGSLMLESVRANILNAFGKYSITTECIHQANKAFYISQGPIFLKALSYVSMMHVRGDSVSIHIPGGELSHLDVHGKRFIDIVSLPFVQTFSAKTEGDIIFNIPIRTLAAYITAGRKISIKTPFYYGQIGVFKAKEFENLGSLEDRPKKDKTAVNPVAQNIKSNLLIETETGRNYGTIKGDNIYIKHENGWVDWFAQVRGRDTLTYKGRFYTGFGSVIRANSMLFDNSIYTNILSFTRANKIQIKSYLNASIFDVKIAKHIVERGIVGVNVGFAAALTIFRTNVLSLCPYGLDLALFKGEVGLMSIASPYHYMMALNSFVLAGWYIAGGEMNMNAVIMSQITDITSNISNTEIRAPLIIDIILGAGKSLYNTDIVQNFLNAETTFFSPKIQQTLSKAFDVGAAGVEWIFDPWKYCTSSLKTKGDNWGILCDLVEGAGLCAQIGTHFLGGSIRAVFNNEHVARHGNPVHFSLLPIATSVFSGDGSGPNLFIFEPIPKSSFDTHNGAVLTGYSHLEVDRDYTNGQGVEEDSVMIYDVKGTYADKQNPRRQPLPALIVIGDVKIRESK